MSSIERHGSLLPAHASGRPSDTVEDRVGPLPDYVAAPPGRGHIIILGALLLLAGIAALGAAAVAALTVTVLFGSALLVASAVQLGQSLLSVGGEGVSVEFLGGLLHGALGAALLIDPAISATTFTVALASLFIGAGALRLVLAAARRHSVRVEWLVTAGLVDLALAASLLIAETRAPVEAVAMLGGAELCVFALAFIVGGAVPPRRRPARPA